MQEVDGTMHDTGHSLCAAPADHADTAKLQVAPCFLPKAPGITSGPYWILAYNEDEGFALVSGGQPNIRTESGCRTGTDAGMGIENGAGLWVFTREQKRDDVLLAKVRAIAEDKGFDTSVLNNVSQENCPNLDHAH